MSAPDGTPGNGACPPPDERLGDAVGDVETSESNGSMPLMDSRAGGSEQDVDDATRNAADANLDKDTFDNSEITGTGELIDGTDGVEITDGASGTEITVGTESTDSTDSEETEGISNTSPFDATVDAADRSARGGVLDDAAAGGLPMPLGYWPLDSADYVAPRRVIERVSGLDGLIAANEGQIGAPGIVGQSFGFRAGVSPLESIVVPPRLNDPLELTTAATLSIWVQFAQLPSDVGNPMALLDKSGWGTDLAILADCAGDSCLSTASGPSAPSNVLKLFFGLNEVDSLAPVQVGAWYHVAATFQYPGLVCLYFNGALQGSCIPSTAPRITDVQPLRFGDGAYFTARPLTGYLDEIAIWTIALTGDQVETLYQLGLAGQPLVAP